MKTIDLNPQEIEVLVKVLARCQADLEHEIRHTDHGEFKRILHQRQIVITGILEKLPVSLERAGAA